MKKTVKFKPTRPHTAEQWVAGEGAPSGKEPQVAMKRFTIDVPVELHTRIKVAAPAGARRWPICFGSFWSVNSQNRNCGFTIIRPWPCPFASPGSRRPPPLPA